MEKWSVFPNHQDVAMPTYAHLSSSFWLIFTEIVYALNSRASVFSAELWASSWSKAKHQTCSCFQNHSNRFSRMINIRAETKCKFKDACQRREQTWLLQLQTRHWFSTNRPRFCKETYDRQPARRDSNYRDVVGWDSSVIGVLGVGIRAVKCPVYRKIG